MKRTFMSFAAAFSHRPKHPERTARRSVDWDVEFRTWPTRAAMLKTVELEGRSPWNVRHWTPLIKPAAMLLTAREQLLRIEEEKNWK